MERNEIVKGFQISFEELGFLRRDIYKAHMQSLIFVLNEMPEFL